MDKNISMKTLTDSTTCLLQIVRLMEAKLHGAYQYRLECRRDRKPSISPLLTHEGPNCVHSYEE